MKTTSITVERNFHIMNDDRFIMEKISVTIELEPFEDDEQGAIDCARNSIIRNFKAAYPKVYTYLNFDDTLQVNPEYAHLLTEQSPNNSYMEAFGKANEQFLKKPASPSTEKINKGTIEEQIQASKDLGELDGWKFIAKSNQKLQEIFSQREKELINEAVK